MLGWAKKLLPLFCGELHVMVRRSWRSNLSSLGTTTENEKDKTRVYVGLSRSKTGYFSLPI